MTITDHVVHDMWDTEYHALTDHLSSTGARKLLPPSTPAHFKHWRDNPQPPSDAFDLGHVVHRLVLGRGAEYVPLDPAVHGLKADGTTAANPTATVAWKNAVTDARAAGKAPIHVSDLATAQRMADRVFDHEDAAPLLANGEPEVSVFADDPVTGVKLRARFDWLDDTTAVDVKTAATAAPDENEFDRAAVKFRYFFQEAFYRHVAEAAGITINEFKFIAVEKAEPHEVAVHEWDDVARNVGKRFVRKAIDTYAHCLEKDQWPGYPRGTNVMGLPMWMLDEELGF